MYCENCRLLVEGDVCPECGKKNLREVQPDDLCLVMSNSQIWTDMACQVLDQEGIPYLKQGELGAAMTVLTGLAVETFHIYVPYTHFAQAEELTQALFQDAEPVEDGVLFEDEPGTEMEKEDD